MSMRDERKGKVRPTHSGVVLRKIAGSHRLAGRNPKGASS